MLTNQTSNSKQPSQNQPLSRVYLKHLSFIPLYLFILLFAGCSFFETPPLGDAGESTPSSETYSAQNQNDLKAGSETRHGLQVTWQVPSEGVDGFVLRYGAHPDSLKDERRLPISSLSQVDDPEFGPVFRYIISDIDPRSSLYVAVAAYKGDRISEFSDVMKDASKAQGN